MTFGDLLVQKDGLIKGPFGGDIKKSLFVPKGDDTYKVYEQGVVLNHDINRGDYYLSKEYFERKLKRFEVKENDILLTGAGTVGELFVVPSNAPKGVINQALLRVRLSKDVVDQNFFCYYFRYYIKAIIGNINGDSVIPNLPPLPLIKSTLIDIPDINYQQKIAAVLSSLDAKIELNQRINAELGAMAKTLYDYWFVQFDFPNEKGQPYKSSGGKMVWNDELKRNIPLGWDVKKLSEWIESDKSGDWGSDEPKGNYVQKVSCIRGTDINGLNGTDPCNPPVRFILKQNSHKILNPHDLIIEISGGAPNQSTGRLGYITIPTLKRFENPLICSNFCKVISLKNKKHIYNFVYQWNMLYDNNVFFNYEGKTSGIKNLLFDTFVSSHWTVEPTSIIVEKFYNFMQDIQAKKQILLLQSQTLEKLRDWLLPMLMNGQVKVK
jgi:type I restriction enzyme S subunit